MGLLKSVKPPALRVGHNSGKRELVWAADLDRKIGTFWQGQDYETSLVIDQGINCRVQQRPWENPVKSLSSRALIPALYMRCTPKDHPKDGLMAPEHNIEIYRATVAPSKSRIFAFDYDAAPALTGSVTYRDEERETEYSSRPKHNFRVFHRDQSANETEDKFDDCIYDEPPIYG